MKPPMTRLYRLLFPILLASAFPAHAAEKPDLHQQLLELADHQQQERRAHFAAVTTKADLETLQESLREKFLRLLGGLPRSKGVPPVTIIGRVVAEDYVPTQQWTLETLAWHAGRSCLFRLYLMIDFQDPGPYSIRFA